MTNLLFLCARNRLRLFADCAGVETASAGRAADAEESVTTEPLVWADIVFVMDPALIALLKARVTRFL